MKAFGIGCLHFSFKGGEKKEITVKKYIDEVKASLEKLSNISDVEIFFDEDIKDEKIDISESTHMNDGDPCHPHIPFFELSFSLYLPRRVQSEVIKRDQVYLDTDNFHVIFKHDWHGPYTVVECVGAGEESSPSTAIQIVREYLKREIDSNSGILKLDFVGPSPFHANFFLSQCEQQASEKSSTFELIHTKVPGYDNIKFEYHKSKFESEEIAFETLISEFSSEIAFFYQLKIMNSSRSSDWVGIQNNLHNLLELEDESHKKTFKDRYSKKPKLLKNLHREIGLFKGQEIFNKNIRDQYYFSIYKSEKHNIYLKSFIDATLDNWPAYPVKETSEIVNYFDGKSSKSVELTVVFFAAVFGGAIGAAITVLFGS
ncbi:hypothetical protein [Aeromonas simiae]|uniref:hypothetical protein n=1 Tax=Aeromonas simiae TaxID=218936 RepID=UPI0005A88B0C|nr:hypothetical protein [Aeromonas simiae]